jgi:hypothetical protein
VDNCVIKSSYYNPTIGKLWSLVKLTKIWSDIFQQNFQQPETVTEAIERLMTVLEGEHKIALAIMRKEDLVDLHFSLGMAIRNAFGLHEPGSKLLASCNNAIHPNASYNATHPDDASGVIIQALWIKLTQGTQ